MNSIQENLPFFTSLFDCLQANLGDNTELVLYISPLPLGLLSPISAMAVFQMGPPDSARNY